MAFQQKTTGSFLVHPTKNDVASIAGDGSQMKEQIAKQYWAQMTGGGDWIISGLSYDSAAGLTATFNSGSASLDGYYVKIENQHQVTLTASQTNHIWLRLTKDGDGNVNGWGFEVNITGTAPAAPYIKLAEVVTNGSTATGSTDRRVTAPDFIRHADVASNGFVVKTGAKTFTNLKTNLAASAAPTTTDDASEGYGVGSLWIDTTGDKVYILVDATTDAAVWKRADGQDDFSESVEDAVAAVITDGTGIGWTYDDGAGTLTGAVTLAPFDTDDLSEGSTNLYYTAARFNSAFSGKTTADLSENTNLYFTNERVDDRVAALIQDGTGLSWTYSDAGGTLTGAVSLSPFTTADLAENTNLYYTDGRVQTYLDTALTIAGAWTFSDIPTLESHGAKFRKKTDDPAAAANYITLYAKTDGTLRYRNGGGTIYQIATQANLDSHTSSTSNPHSVTAAQVGLGSVENTALSSWAGTSNITTVASSAVTAHQAALSLTTSQISDPNQANGVLVLNGSAKIATSFLPALAISETYVVANQTAQLALSAQEGDIAVRSDENKSYIHNGGSAGDMTDWQELLTPTDQVLSVNGYTGAVTLAKSDLGLGSVENTALSTWAGTSNITTVAQAAVTAHQAAITITESQVSDLGTYATAAALTSHTGNTSNPHSVTKAQVGLGSVENTALSTWAGTTNVTTLGTIATGVWNGTAIAGAYLNAAIADLSNVQGTATDGQVLTWNNTGGYWEPQDTASTVTAFNDLSDVTLSSVVTGNLVRYNGSAWVNYPEASLSITESQISDFGSYLTLSGGTLSGALTLSGAPTQDLHAATKAYVDAFSNAGQLATEVTQTAHGFAVGDVIRSAGTDDTFTKAQADSSGNAEVAGIVTEVADVNTFTYSYGGSVEVAAAVPTATAGTVLYLDPSTSGTLTSTDPSGVGEISKPLAVVTDDGSKMLWVNYRGMEITAADIYLSEELVDAKGDLIVGTANDQAVRFGVGTNGQVLLADSNEAAGVIWTTFTKSHVSLGNVENTALSTWAGTSNVTTVAQSAVTAHQAALSITESQVSDLQSYALASALTSHTGNTSNPHSVTKAQVGLTSVEDTALSTWAGTTNITTLGTIGTGTWNGSVIDSAYIDQTLSVSTLTATGAVTVAGATIDGGAGDASIDFTTTQNNARGFQIESNGNNFYNRITTNDPASWIWKDYSDGDALVVTSTGIVTTGSSMTVGGALAISGALTGATTGSFSGNVTIGGTGTLSGTVGEFGTISAGAGSGGYSGYALNDNRAVLMGDVTHVGLYNDTANKWFLLAYEGAAVSLYYNGTAQFRTTATGSESMGDFAMSGALTGATTGNFSGTVTAASFSGAILSSDVTNLDTAIDNRIDTAQTVSGWWIFNSGVDFNSHAYFKSTGVTLQQETSAPTGVAGYSRLWADDAATLKYRDGTGTVYALATTAQVWATSSITSGTFADARISESSVTQHEAALSLTKSQVSDFDTSVDSRVQGQAYTVTGAWTFTGAPSLSQATTDTELFRLVRSDISRGLRMKTYEGTYGWTLELSNDLATWTDTLSIDSNRQVYFHQDIDVETGISIAGTEIVTSGRVLQNVTGAAGLITSGTFADARIAASNVTQHQAALSVTASQVSDFSTAADARITAQKAAANGLATLGADSKIPTAQLPALALTERFTVANQTAQLALTAQEGDIAIRTDENKTYVHNGGSAGTMADWSELLTPTDSVTSVNGNTGVVVLDTGDIAEGSNMYYTDARVDARLDATQTITGNWTFNANQVFANNVELRWKDSGGTDRTVLELDSSDIVNLGSSAGGGTIFRGNSYANVGSYTGAGAWTLPGTVSTGALTATDLTTSGFTLSNAATNTTASIYTTAADADGNYTGIQFGKSADFFAGIRSVLHGGTSAASRKLAFLVAGDSSTYRMLLSSSGLTVTGSATAAALTTVGGLLVTSNDFGTVWRTTAGVGANDSRVQHFFQKADTTQLGRMGVGISDPDGEVFDIVAGAGGTPQFTVGTGYIYLNKDTTVTGSLTATGGTGVAVTATRTNAGNVAFFNHTGYNSTLAITGNATVGSNNILLQAGASDALSLSAGGSDAAHYTISSGGNHDFQSGTATFGSTVTALDFTASGQANPEISIDTSTTTGFPKLLWKESAANKWGLTYHATDNLLYAWDYTLNNYAFKLHDNGGQMDLYRDLDLNSNDIVGVASLTATGAVSTGALTANGEVSAVGGLYMGPNTREAGNDVHFEAGSTSINILSESTGLDGVVNYKLRNDAQEFTLALRGDLSDSLYIRDNTAAAWRFELDTSGNFDLKAGDVITTGAVSTGALTVTDTGILEVKQHVGDSMSIQTGTTNGFDTYALHISSHKDGLAGGRGSYLSLHGADHASYAGEIHLIADGGKHIHAHGSLKVGATFDAPSYTLDVLGTMGVSGAVTVGSIDASDVDFIVKDTTDGVANFIWRYHAGSALYLGTDDAVVTLRSALDLNNESILNGAGATFSNAVSTGALTVVGATTITTDDADFILTDTTDSPSHYFWRDWSSSALYIGTDTAVPTLRATLDLNSNPIINGAAATFTGAVSTGVLTVNAGTGNEVATFTSTDATSYIRVTDDTDSLYLTSSAGTAYIGGSPLGGGVSMEIDLTSGAATLPGSLTVKKALTTVLMLSNLTAAVDGTKAGMDFRMYGSADSGPYIGGAIHAEAEGTWTATSGTRNASLLLQPVASGSAVTALTLASDLSATFAGTLDVTGAATLSSSLSVVNAGISAYAMTVRRSATGTAFPDIYGDSGYEGVMIGYNSSGTELYVGNAATTVTGTLTVNHSTLALAVDSGAGSDIAQFRNDNAGSLTIGQTASLTSFDFLAGDSLRFREGGNVPFKIDPGAVTVAGTLDVTGAATLSSTVYQGTYGTPTTGTGWRMTTGDLYAQSNAADTFRVEVATGYVTANRVYLVDTNTQLSEGAGNSVRVTTNYGYIDIGAQNGSYAHFQTGLSAFHFSAPVELASTLTVTGATTLNDNVTIAQDGTSLTMTPGATSYAAIRINSTVGGQQLFLGTDYGNTIAAGTANGDGVLRQDSGTLHFAGTTTSFGTMDAATGDWTLKGETTVLTGGVGQNPDMFFVKHTNLTQGIGFGYDQIQKVGTTANSNLYIDAAGTGDLVLQATSTGAVTIEGSGGVAYLDSGSANDLSLRAGGSNSLRLFASGHVAIYEQKYLYFDGGSDTYIGSNAANNVRIVTGGKVSFDLDVSSLVLLDSDDGGAVDSNYLSLGRRTGAGDKLILGTKHDGSDGVTEGFWKIGATESMRWTTTGVSIPGALTVTGAATLTGDVTMGGTLDFAAGGFEEILIKADDSGGEDRIRWTVNDGQGNMAIILGVDENGNMLGDGGGAKILFGGDSADGYISLNVADDNAGVSGNPVVFNAGLVFDETGLRIGNPNDTQGLADGEGQLIADVSGKLWGSGVNSVGDFTGNTRVVLTKAGTGGEMRIINSTNSVTGRMLVQTGDVWFGAETDHQVKFGVGNSSRWLIEDSGGSYAFRPNGGTYDLGASGNRVGTIYGGSADFTGTITTTGTATTGNLFVGHPTILGSEQFHVSNAGGDGVEIDHSVIADAIRYMHYDRIGAHYLSVVSLGSDHDWRIGNVSNMSLDGSGNLLLDAGGTITTTGTISGGAPTFTGTSIDLTMKSGASSQTHKFIWQNFTGTDIASIESNTGVGSIIFNPYLSAAALTIAASTGAATFTGTVSAQYLSLTSNDSWGIWKTTAAGNKRIQTFFHDSTDVQTGRIGIDIAGADADTVDLVAGSGSTPQFSLSTTNATFAGDVLTNGTVIRIDSAGDASIKADGTGTASFRLQQTGSDRVAIAYVNATGHTTWTGAYGNTIIETGTGGSASTHMTLTGSDQSTTFAGAFDAASGLFSVSGSGTVSHTGAASSHINANPLHFFGPSNGGLATDNYHSIGYAAAANNHVTGSDLGDLTIGARSGYGITIGTHATPGSYPEGRINIEAGGAITVSGATTFASTLDVTGTTTVAGLTVSGTATFQGYNYHGDGDMSIYGSGSDLKIYHDGSNSWIIDENAPLRIGTYSANHLWLYTNSSAAWYVSGSTGDIVPSGTRNIGTASAQVTNVYSTYLTARKATDAYFNAENTTTQTAAGYKWTNAGTLKWNLYKTGAAHGLYLDDATGTVLTILQGGAATFASTLDVTGNVAGSAYISAATDFRMAQNSYYRVAQLDSGSMGGGYNSDIASGVMTHDSTGAHGSMMFSNSGWIRFFANTSQAAGSNATERLRIDSTGISTLNHKIVMGTGDLYAGGVAVGAGFTATSGTNIELSHNGTTGEITSFDRDLSAWKAMALRASTIALAPQGSSMLDVDTTKVKVSGSMVVGAAAVATTATDGFLYIPTCAGAPTGTPTTQTGTVPLVYDSTNGTLYVYDGGWQQVSGDAAVG